MEGMTKKRMVRRIRQVLRPRAQDRGAHRKRVHHKFSTAAAHKVPVDLQKVLVSARAARAAWKSITSLARNEWICWILSAKKSETRSRRIERTCTELIDGKRRPCCWAGCSHRSK